MSIIQTARISNVTLTASQTATYTLSWPVPFTDNSYFVDINTVADIGNATNNDIQLTGWTKRVNGQGLLITFTNNGSVSHTFTVESVGMVTNTDDNFIQFTSRLNNLDGIGLTSPDTGVVPVLVKNINGINTKLGQITLSMQSQINNLTKLVVTLQTLLNQHLQS